MLVDLNLMSVALELSADESERKAARIYEAIMEAQRPLRYALTTIREAIPGYLKGEMSEHDFALLVLEQADSSIVNKALENVK